MTKPSNLESIEKTTGTSWEKWIEFLEGINAKDLPHPDIAKAVHAKLAKSSQLDNAGWWAQGITVAYEQHIGRRAPGQRSDGTFEVAVSKTINGTTKQGMDLWLAYTAGKTEFNEVKLAKPATTSHTSNRYHWGVSLEDGTRVNADVDTYGKPSGKFGLTITHIRLNSAQSADTWRSYWKDIITNLAS